VFNFSGIRNNIKFAFPPTVAEPANPDISPHNVALPFIELAQ
jgi:hypothetical protein